MSEDPAELERFYTETVQPLVAYDAQYETDLVQTLETFLECDGNVAGTAQRLYTHRHTVRYRLERVRDLSGLDVGSTDGRERLGLGLKAMRVLGIASPQGPASEAGAGAGPRPARREGPVITDPRLSGVAEELEATGGAAEVYDREWRLVYLTSQFRFFAGDRSLEELGLGRHAVEIRVSELHGMVPPRRRCAGCGRTSR
jgi:hypothetical protein